MANYELVFSVEPMYCMGCVNHIKDNLDNANAKSNQFDFYEVNLDQKTIHFFIDSKESEMLVVNQFTAWLNNVLKDRTVKYLAKQSSKFTHQIGAFLGLGLGSVWITLALSGIILPLGFSLAFTAISCISMFGIAWPFIKNAWRALYNGLKNKKYNALFNMDSLFVLTGLIVLVSSITSLFFPLFPHLLESGLLIFGFRHLGCIFQAYLDKKIGLSRSLIQTFRHKSYEQTNESNAILPKKTAQLFKNGEYIRLKKGDVLPVDGKIIFLSPGVTIVDNVKDGSYFSTTSPKRDEGLYAGVEVTEGELVIQVENSLTQSRFKKLDEVVNQFQSNANKAEILQQAERWLQWFIPALFLLAIVTGIWVGQVFSLTLAIQCMSSILVSACPCTLGLIIPMAMRMGAYKASLHQLIFKSSEALQLAAKTSIFVLDYNGTLTEGAPEVNACELNSPQYDKAHVLNILYAFESKMLSERQGQLIGSAIQKYARDNLLDTQISELHLDSLTWRTGGASVKLNQQTWYLGNNQLLQDLNIQFEEMNPQRHYLLVQESETAELNMIAIIDIQDKLRPDALSLVKELQHLKKKVKICTGADEFTVERILKELNISKEDIHANCSYEQKPEYIKQLREQHGQQIIAMIGDGANDKHALEASDLRIWIKNTKLPEVYQQTLCEIANIEIHGDKLQGISVAFAIAEQTVNLIYQNLALSFIYNFIVLSIACGGLLYVGMSLPPAMGVCLMVIQSALLALNTYRILLTPVEPTVLEETTSFTLQTAKA